MNFNIYKTLEPKERFFADLLLELIEEVKKANPTFVGEFDDDSDLGPLAGINDLDEVTKIADSNQGGGA